MLFTVTLYFLPCLLVFLLLNPRFLTKPNQKKGRDSYFPERPRNDGQVADAIECLLGHSKEVEAALTQHRVVAYRETAKAAGDFFVKGKPGIPKLNPKGCLTAEDLKRHNSSKIFECHRVVGRYNIDPGLLIRLTVNSNLFGGSVANLGSEEQVKWLQGV